MKYGICRNCGLEFRGRNEQTSCSRSCAAESRDQRADKNPNWKGGVCSAEKGQKYRARYPLKDIAHRAVRNALRSGKLVKELCEWCGSWATEAHHDDYKRPLKVTWLCKPCHLAAHHKNPSRYRTRSAGRINREEKG